MKILITGTSGFIGYHLAKSYLADPAAIISIAQHARPKVTGHMDCVRDHLTALSIVVVKILSGEYIKYFPHSLGLVRDIFVF